MFAPRLLQGRRCTSAAAGAGPGLEALCQDTYFTAGHQPQLIVRQHKAAIVEDKAEPVNGRICYALAAFFLLVLGFFFLRLL